MGRPPQSALHTSRCRHIASFKSEEELSSEMLYGHFLLQYMCCNSAKCAQVNRSLHLLGLEEKVVCVSFASGANKRRVDLLTWYLILADTLIYSACLCRPATKGEACCHTPKYAIGTISSKTLFLGPCVSRTPRELDQRRGVFLAGLTCSA